MRLFKGSLGLGGAVLSLRYPLKTINHNTSTVLRMGQLLQNILALSS